MRSVLLCLCAALVVSGCGKRGNPLPPLVRIPAAPGDFAVSRLDDRVLVRVTAPATNIDGAQPADIARIEIYAVSIEGQAPDLDQVELEDLRELSTLVGSEPVRPPSPPPPPVKEGMPPIPTPPPGPGIDQGGTVVIAEQLTPETRTPVAVSQLRPMVPEDIEVPRPLSAPPEGMGLQRYYFAVAVSPRGRYGPPTALTPAPLGPTSGPPSAPRVTVNEASMSLQWTPPTNARGLGLAGEPDWLPAQPIVPGPPPTTYEVYEVPRNTPPDAPLTMPVPLTSEPIGGTEYTEENITLGTERCFHVRAVDIVDGVPVRGPSSPVTCASFADTFAPAPPRELVAVGVAGGINLIWESSPSDDVAGYLVLRGEAGSATLTALTSAPVTTPSFRDESVNTGRRYVYAVVAVDRAGNRSAESNRVEETAR